jgi:hypothetical protein
MPMLTLALFSGAGAFVYVAWGSWVGGYPPELALARGVVGFMGMSLLGFVAELTIATVRPDQKSQSRAQREPTPIRPLDLSGAAQPDAAAEETRRAA